MYNDDMSFRQSVAGPTWASHRTRHLTTNVVAYGQFLLDVAGLLGTSSVYILRARSLRGEYFTLILPVVRSLKQTQTQSSSGFFTAAYLKVPLAKISQCFNL